MPLSKPDANDEDAEHLGNDTGDFYGETPQEHYGGPTFVGAFFGWLVAVGMTVLLTGIIGAGVIAAGIALYVTPSQAEQQAGTIGLAGAVALLVILTIAYFTGGYAAGRMSRFEGGRQGLGVWLLGLLALTFGGASTSFRNPFHSQQRPRTSRDPSRAPSQGHRLRVSRLQVRGRSGVGADVGPSRG